jgi:chromosome segregation ATPase
MGYRGDDSNDLKHAVATAFERITWLRAEELSAPERIASLRAQADGIEKRLPELHGDIAQQESLLASLRDRFEKAEIEERLVKQIRTAREKLDRLKRAKHG